jgi:hypothetical protein
MAGVLGIYGLIVAVIIQGSSKCFESYYWIIEYICIFTIYITFCFAIFFLH